MQSIRVMKGEFRWYKDTPLQDGVFIDFEALPGGNLPDFNLGNTVVSPCALTNPVSAATTSRGSTLCLVACLHLPCRLCGLPPPNPYRKPMNFLLHSVSQNSIGPCTLHLVLALYKIADNDSLLQVHETGHWCVHSLRTWLNS